MSPHEFGLAAAAVLAVFVSISHSVIGERLIFSRLRRGEAAGAVLDRPVFRRLFHIFWHFPSVIWTGAAALLATLGLSGENVPLVAVPVTALFVFSGAANLYATRTLHPGGLMLLAVGALFTATLGLMT